MTDAHLDRVTRRMYWLIVALGVVGAGAAFAKAGWQAGLGFLLGAAASYLNFHWLHSLVDAMGEGKARPLLAFFLGNRYFLFGIVAYLIVKWLGINLMAALAGLLVPVAAIFAEVLYEFAVPRRML